MKVILLGAGASKSYEASPRGVRMPVSRDFFETFEKLPIFTNPWVLKEAVLEYLMRIKSVDPLAYLRSGIDIERLGTEIEERLLDALESGEQFDRVLALRPYTQLTCIFASVINEIQNGPISNAHKAIAEHLSPNDVVLTFNWDTLMDRALADASDWSTDYGYGFRPKSIYRNEWVEPTRNGCRSCVELLKLHGSTNWITSHPIFSEEGTIQLMQDASLDTVWVYEHATEPYDCYAGRFMAGYEPYSYGYYPPNIMDDIGKSAPEGHVIVSVRQKPPWRPEGTSGDSGLTSIPLIIPPVLNKKYA